MRRALTRIGSCGVPGLILLFLTLRHVASDLNKNSSTRAIFRRRRLAYVSGSKAWDTGYIHGGGGKFSAARFLEAVNISAACVFTQTLKISPYNPWLLFTTSVRWKMSVNKHALVTEWLSISSVVFPLSTWIIVSAMYQKDDW